MDNQKSHEVENVIKEIRKESIKHYKRNNYILSNHNKKESEVTTPPPKGTQGQWRENAIKWAWKNQRGCNRDEGRSRKTPYS